MGKVRIYIGTSGYSYRHWQGVFYPKDVSMNAWLEYYATFFDTVELNVTFYRLPQERAFKGWYRRTPKDFVFAVKGSRFITHIRRLKDCRDAMRLFLSRIILLREKLGVVLWQLPPSFKVDTARFHAFLNGAVKEGPRVRHTFEFRNDTWYCEPVFEILRSNGAALCSADWPKRNTRATPTNGFQYVRRHGQGADLYGGSYSRRQLQRDAALIEANRREKRDTYIYFNNDRMGMR